jgi:hypothetical protein
MQRLLVPLLACVFLTGCWGGWDEAAERAGCSRAYLSDPKKAEECYTQRKLAYDREVALAREAAKK